MGCKMHDLMSSDILVFQLRVDSYESKQAAVALMSVIMIGWGGGGRN